jgi:ketosteroid isomerase-like protein
MSRENMELLRRAVELANAGDLEAVAELYHAHAELRDLQHPPDTPEVLEGRAAIMAGWATWSESFDDFTVEVFEYIDAHPWVVGDVRWRATGKGSNVSIDWHVAEAYEVIDGKIVRVIAGFPNVAAALEAVGPGGVGVASFASRFANPS